MKKKSLLMIGLLSLLVLLGGVYVVYGDNLGICEGCFAYDPIVSTVGEPFIVMGLALLMSTIIVGFAPYHAYVLWRRFFFTYSALAVILIFTTPISCSAGCPFDRGSLYPVLAGLFLLISIIIAIVKRKPKMVS